MLDLLLLASLGFLGSFGHCAGMCGPIAAAFSLSDTSSSDPARSSRWAKLRYHLLLNLGRILSYALVGAAIGALGSVLIAGGQMAGVGSLLRRGMALITGSLLIWFGLSQVAPGVLPKLPFLHPLLGGKWHDRLSQGMVKLSFGQHWLTPFLLGSVWGLIPCGFLYAAQIKAAETGNLWRGMASLLAFGIGTMPMMVGVGVSIGSVSADRRSQLFRLGGWITLLIGILTLMRTGDVMSDYTGYGAILCLMLALAARPIARLWAAPLQYRRVLGVSAFLLALAHTLHMIEHSWQWNFDALFFMPVPYQIGIVLGGIALLLMLPAAITSFDRAQQKLGKAWRSIHLLSIPALLLAAAHTISTGSEFLGAMQPTAWNWGWTIGLGLTVAIVLLLRCSWLWSIFALKKFYVPPYKTK
ncbi:urease accessory protein UreH domain-containing protein [Leptolyngbya ohadii]|uniref:urease accessory protein UreH domain-containing protein n=1 Tax=Leptolyngbya ohadii TaxID=1962290 RepID=UPI000B59FA88|nr:sulfite exporter TauE/SafE family protein [Leptolyngbya ohadii]